MCLRLDVRDVFSPDIDRVWDWVPDDRGAVYYSLELELGEPGAEAGTLFQAQIATPEALARRLGSSAPLTGRCLVIIREYNWSNLEEYLRRIVHSCNGDSLPMVTRELMRYFLWEYENHHFIGASGICGNAKAQLRQSTFRRRGESYSWSILNGPWLPEGEPLAAAYYDVMMSVGIGNGPGQVYLAAVATPRSLLDHMPDFLELDVARRFFVVPVFDMKRVRAGLSAIVRNCCAPCVKCAQERLRRYFATQEECT